MIRKPRWYERIKWAILLILVSSFYMYNTSSFSSLSIVLFSGLLFCVHVVQNKGIIQVPLTAFHVMVLGFSLFCFASALWANDSSAAISKGVTVLEILVCMSIVYWCFLDKLSARDLLTAIMWSGVIVAIYSIYYYGVPTFFAMVTGSTRIGNDYANSNAIGMWSAICVVLFCYFILNEGWKWRYCMIVMSILLVAMSQSRTALIETVVGILMVLFFRYRDQRNFFNGLIKVLFALCAAFCVLMLMSQISVFSGLTERMQSLFNYYKGNKVSESSVIQRSLYIQAGLAQFKKTPIFGIGIGNTYQVTLAATGHNTYLHNNFIELLTAGGIVGFGLYYVSVIYLIVKLLPCALRKNSVSDACLIILFIHTISDYGTVSYYMKGHYFILVACFLQVYFNQMKIGNLDDKYKDADD